MIRIEGFDSAKQLFIRKTFLESFTAFSQLATQPENTSEEKPSPQEVVGRILDDVHDRGDEALFYYTRELDGVALSSLEVGRQEISAAYEMADEKLVSALKLAAKRIRQFHLACAYKSGIVFVDRYLGRKICPLDKVGLYIPGGTAVYPSTVLMTAIPAKVAGVREIVITSPPGKNGSIAAPTLVAADIADVSRIFKVGGAQAIAALAFGTESIPKVDKICGPGNIFVTLAKKMVYGNVAIDGLQGPSEIIVVADETANPSFCAADLLAQAEHDALASAILITTSSELANQTDREISSQLIKMSRKSIATQAIEKGIIVLVSNIDEAIELVNLYAPEHLSLMISDASSIIHRIHNAGCMFIGENSPVVLGDYVAGPSHVLPTGGSARFTSPLGIDDFMKTTNIVALDKVTMQELIQPAITIARAEGLDAHARAASLRFETPEEAKKQQENPKN